MTSWILLYLALSFAFAGIWARAGWVINQRRAKAEYRWWSSRVVEHDLSELPPVIRAEELI